MFSVFTEGWSLKIEGFQWPVQKNDSLKKFGIIVYE